MGNKTLGTRDLIRSTLAEGKWYTSADIIDITGLSRCKVISSISAMAEVNLMEKKPHPTIPRSNVYRLVPKKINDNPFGVSQRLHDFNQLLRGSHAP